MEIATATFNSDLYVVAATVLPVLFIALLLPDGILARYAIWVKNVRGGQLARLNRKARRKGTLLPPATALTGVFRIYDALILPVTAVFALFVMGEISAAHALDHGHASRAEHSWVIDALVALPVITAVSTLASISFRWAAQRPDGTPKP